MIRFAFKMCTYNFLSPLTTRVPLCACVIAIMLLDHKNDKSPYQSSPLFHHIMSRVRKAISIVMRKRWFSHKGMFLFSYKERINLQEGRSRNKIHFHSIFKECFYVLKDFDQSQELPTRKIYNFTSYIPT